MNNLEKVHSTNNRRMTVLNKDIPVRKLDGGPNTIIKEVDDLSDSHSSDMERKDSEHISPEKRTKMDQLQKKSLRSKSVSFIIINKLFI